MNSVMDTYVCLLFLFRAEVRGAKRKAAANKILVFVVQSKVLYMAAAVIRSVAKLAFRQAAVIFENVFRFLLFRQEDFGTFAVHLALNELIGM